LNIQGNGAISIIGGPTRSIQVNSAAQTGSCGQSNCSVNLPWGSATIDLSAAGPSGQGADMALSGFPQASPGGFNGGTLGHWLPKTTPIGDPFAQLCYPGQDTTTCTGTINSNAAPAVPGAPSAVTASGGTSCTGG